MIMPFFSNSKKMTADRKYSVFLEMVQGEDERDVLRAMVRTMISELMREEIAQHLGAEPRERARELDPENPR